MPITEPVYILCILLITILIAHLLAIKVRISSIVILILLGTILGSNVLGIIARDQQLILLEKMGLLYIMLLAGMQMDLSNLKRLGMRSLIFGLLTFMIPLTIGIITGKIIALKLLACILLGLLYSPHTLISYPILMKLKLNHNEAINVAVGGTIVTSILTLVGLSLVQAFTGKSLNLFLAIKLFVLLPIFVCFYLWKIPKLGKSIIQDNPENLSIQFIFVLTCLFVAASATLLLGVDSIIGAFITGLTLNRLIPLTSSLMQKINFVGNSLFIPMFLISVGVLCNPKILFSNPENLGIAFLVITGAVGGKFIAAWVSGKSNHYYMKEIMIMFSLTISRAALVLVIGMYGKKAELLTEGIFNAVILYIIITCLTGPILTDIFGNRIINNISKIRENSTNRL